MAPAMPGEEPAQAEGGGLEQGGVDADGVGGILVLADGDQSVAELAFEHQPGDQQQDHQHPQGDVKEEPVAGVDGKFGYGQIDARVAFGDPQVLHQGLGRLRQPQGGDGEVVSLEAQDRQTGDKAVGRAQKAAQQQRREKAETEIAHEDGGCIGAQAEKDDVAEGGVARIAADDVPAAGQDGEDQDVGGVAQGEVAEKEGQDSGRADDQGREDEGFFHG